jgi:hypothetical protein
MIIIGPRIATWHQFELGLSASLIDSFVRGVELQALETFDQYQKEKQTHVVTYGDDDGEELVEEFRGLNSGDFDLPSLFQHYFPSLQRRSAFMTVWGFFEHELNKLCSLYQREKRFTLELSDMNGDGVDRSTKYLAKVAGLDVHYDSREWQTIQRLRMLRNAIAHKDGKLLNKRGEPLPELISFVAKSSFLTKDSDEVVLKEGFLTFVVDTFSAYFKLIGESIAQKESAP